MEERARDRTLDPFRPVAYLLEHERGESGESEPGAVIFLTNRSCPWHCIYCDLWKNTLSRRVPLGAIPTQIDWALERLTAPTFELNGAQREEIAATGKDAFHRVLDALSKSEAETPKVGSAVCPRTALKRIKLYNAGSFFDAGAIPRADFPAIAERVRSFQRVIVECHPALVGDVALRFRDLVQPARLEVAMGLETAHPEVLERLNKHMSLALFARAAQFLVRHGIGVRAFVLVQPPFIIHEAEALSWAQRSVDFAFDCGAGVVVLIPTRSTTLGTLERAGQFVPPKLATLEAALDYGCGLQRGRVFADVWDLEQFSTCNHCFAARRARLIEMNFTLTIIPRITCDYCG